MRTKIIVSLFIIVVIAVSQFIKPLKNFSHTNETNTLTDSLPFIIGAYANANENNVDLLKDSLGMNMWHTFLKETIYATIVNKNYYRPLGWDTTDILFYPNNQSNPAVRAILERNEEKLRTLMYRPKIEWLFFAQRSDYQCEKESFLSNHDYNWFYTYNEHPRGRDVLDDSPYGQGARVRYCGTRDPDLKGMPMDSGYAVKGLKTNREQVNTGNPGHGYPYPGYGDGQFSWFVKPRIRIDSTFAANPANFDTNICRIEVYDFEGNKISNKDIKVKHFKEDINSIYHGNYIETYYDYPTDTANTVILNGWDFNPNDKSWYRYSEDICNVDFRVFWYGKCDMWIDYVRVDDDRANILFGDPASNDTKLYYDMIQHEVTNAQYTTSPLLFYIDEFEFNHIPAISFVMKKIQSYAGSQNVPFALATNSPNDFYNNHLPNGWLYSDHFKRYMFDSCKVKLYCKSNSYPFTGRRDTNSQFISYLPNTLPIISSPHNSAQVKNPNAYEEWLQNWIKSYYKSDCQELQNLSKMKPEMNTCFSIQTHAHFAEDSLREPTNEEIKMNVNMALSYGFKGIIYYAYDAFGTIGDSAWSVALVEKSNNTLIPRRINFYGQKKWDEIKKINSTLNKWAPYLQSFDVGMTKTYMYDIYDESQDLKANTYISELRSYQPDNSISQSPSNFYDDPNQTYSQVSVFNNSASASNFTNYFMVVNRRCSPFRPEYSISGGLRYMKIKLQDKYDLFANFNNWVIKDIKNDSIIKVFNKNSLDFIDLGWYEPAEGRIYKLAPVMVEGGTFVCNELVTATTFNCNGTVNTGGYNLNIPATNGLTTISFAQNGTIQGDNGSDFIIRGYNQIVLQGQNGNKWRGLEIDNCANINIHNTKIKDIGDVAPSSYWALSIYDCPSVEISSCNFELPPQAKGININNFSAEETAVTIMNNNISVSNSTAAIFVGCSSFGYRHLFLMDNVITNNGNQSTFGVLLNNVFSWYADRNTITGFEIGMKLLNSTLDMCGNSITSVGGNNTAILATSSSTVNIGLIGNYYIEGHNTFSNYGDNSKNISLSNSVFEMNYGNNNMTVDNTAGCFNLVGNGNFTTSGDGPIKFIEAIGNCFNGEGNNAIDSITDLEGLRYTLNEDPHNCNIQQDRIADFTAPVINNIVDTVYRSTLPQYQNSSPSVGLYRDFYKSVMKRNYDSTKILGTILLTNYSDSITTADIISLLYFANTKLADISANMLTLKTFLEQLIINHPQNLTLVRTANYFVQKCKVHLQQFTSALDGYQDIIVQNPYSYEGLVASWDYASTLLLANSGGAYSNNEDESLNSLVLESQFLIDSLRMKRLMNTDNYDKKVFTQDDRKVLIKSVGDVLKDDRQKQIEKVKSLEEELHKSKGNNTSKVKQKLEEVKNLNSLIKTKRPKDAEEYKVIINNDIEKLYPKKTSGDSNPQITVPQTYALYQNYPNPFNPTTKIAYDIPRDAKVKLVIYDILGREMKTLVNNEFRSAGKYITEFNGSNLASGIYFARILVNEGKDFMAVKKMVLLK